MTLESGTVTIGLSAANLAYSWSPPNGVALNAMVSSTRGSPYSCETHPKSGFQISSAARAYYMTMLFNLNMYVPQSGMRSLIRLTLAHLAVWAACTTDRRQSGGAVMNDPSLSHLTSQLRTRPSLQLSHTGSTANQPKPVVIGVVQDMATATDEVCPAVLKLSCFSPRLTIMLDLTAKSACEEAICFC